ncbi:MAG: L,D-transpeptidase family protein, partial [Myxococcales bacterium]
TMTCAAALRYLLALSALIGMPCCGDRRPQRRGGAPGQGAAKAIARAKVAASSAVPGSPPRSPRHNADALPPAPADLPGPRRALQITDGVERIVDVDAARHAGLTLVDLSDDWAPIIFADGKVANGTTANGTPLPNQYRAVFQGLANDRTDGDGQPLAGGEKNYLELLGVPPSLSVVRARMLHDAARTCEDVDRVKLLAVPEISTWGATTEQKELARHEARGKRLEAARLAAGAAAPFAAAPVGVTSSKVDLKLASELKAHLRFAAERAAFAEVERRVLCEGLMVASRHKAGRYDTVMRAAVYDFQQKHAVLAQGDLNRATLEAMAKSPLALDFAALRRVLTERAIHAGGGIIEDGTATATAFPTAAGAPLEPATYPGSDGGRHPVPNLAAAATDAVLEALDLVTPEEALAFFQRHPAADFAHLQVAARFPPLPEYYQGGRPLELSAEIDRGDVWYDFPFDASGNRVYQPRDRFPTFTLFVRWRGERVPLVRWRTTVGSWRSELASDGQEYYSFKISDVGPRVWRHVVAAPVWLPPASSPLGSMVKEKRVNGAFVNVTNYDETGPGYLSAYGLVAAIHEGVRRGPEGTTFSDNGIRTHGSFDYLSLRGRFSHGCHRLYNNLAVRLFSFALNHHKVRVLGPVALNFRRTFWWGGDLFDLRLPSRGFYFEMDPPIPVETLEGRIRGIRQTPVVGYVQKPGVKYITEKPPALDESPETKAAGGDEP